MTTFPVTDTSTRTFSSTNPFRPAPMTPEEIQKVSQIVEITCCSEADAIKHLRRKNGNLEQAMDAILSGENAEPAPRVMTEAEISTLREAVAGAVATHDNTQTGKTSPPMIDLTGDGDEDEELNRAMKMSMEDQGTTFRPSDRAPNPDWAMVPSNVEVRRDVVSQDDQEMSQAIEASLQFEISNDGYEEISLEKRVRKGHSPVALRPTLPTLAHAGLILHALFFVPQVRQTVAKYRPPTSIEFPDEALTPPTSGPDWMLWSLLELFVNMDIARMSELNVDKCTDAFQAVQWNVSAERPGDVSTEFYNNLAYDLEQYLCIPIALEAEQFDWPRLFFFRYDYADAEPQQKVFDDHIDLSVVKVDVRGTPGHNDLLSCLAAELFTEHHLRPQAIFKPSEVVAFQLVRSHVPPEREIFSFPSHLYLDQFLKENAELAATKRKAQWDMANEIQTLLARRNELTHYDNRDVLADLRSSIFYFENVAEADDEVRKAQIEDTLAQLRKVLEGIEAELKEIEETIRKCREEAAHALECPELQKRRYDLRVVLVHDGFPGRNHIYSYVKYKGSWWKTVDYVVAEVPEKEVLGDASGLHLGAGPYFLIYSAALSEEQENAPIPWPENLKDSVKHNNIAFLSALPESVRATVVDPNSPPVTPYLPPTPTEDGDSPPELTEPLVSASERMDVD